MKVIQLYPNSPESVAVSEFAGKHGVLFNSPAWLSVYASHALVRCAILNNNNEIIGCFVYYQFKKSLFTFVISPPYTPHIDLFYINPAASVVGKNTFNKEVSDTLADYISELKCQYLSLNLPGHISDTQPFIWKGFNSRTRFTYLIDLGLTSEQLWDNLSSEKRKSINKAEKDGLEIRESREYDRIYELVINSLDRNQKAKNTGIIKSILFDFANQDNSFAFMAYANHKPIAATFCVRYGDSALYLFGGSDAERSHHGAGVSCMWHSILKSKSLGLRHFDFEGSMNESIERYFREFGGQLKPYFCIEKMSPLVSSYFSLKGNKPV